MLHTILRYLVATLATSFAWNLSPLFLAHLRGQREISTHINKDVDKICEKTRYVLVCLW